MKRCSLVGSLPKDQLFNLCGAAGATSQRIQKYAPFLEALPATRHAMQVLPKPGSMPDWSEAARALLICVAKPNGAAGLNDKMSAFVIACLALDSSTLSMTQRLYNLVESGTHKFPTSRTALLEMRKVAMANLASSLHSLTEYPCASTDDLRQVARQVAAHVKIIAEYQLPTLTDFERLDLYRYIFEELPKATALFRASNFDYTLMDRLGLIVDAISKGAYQRLFDDVHPRGMNILVLPELVPELYSRAQSFYEPESAEVDLTVRLIYWIMRDTEEHELWEEALAVSGAGQISSRMAAQQRRLRRYFDERVLAG